MHFACVSGTEAINRDPNNPQFFVRRGHARIDNGEFEEAVRDMQRGIGYLLPNPCVDLFSLYMPYLSLAVLCVGL